MGMKLTVDSCYLYDQEFLCSLVITYRFKIISCEMDKSGNWEA